MSIAFDAASSYARRGWRVFPVHGIHNGRCTCGRRDCSSPGKHPIVRRGLHDATTDEEVIHDWWARWRRANVAVATGRASGIVVVDIDLGPRTNTSFGSLVEEEQEQKRKTAVASLHVLTSRLPRTLISLTGGGGVHVIYRARGDALLRNRTSGLPGIASKLPGVDLRAERGYVLVPPSLHISGNRYEWLDATRDIASAPEWLRDPPRRVPAIARVTHHFDGDDTRRGLKVLRRQLEVLSRAQVGERNHTLNRCAFIVARHVAAGHLDETAARAQLTRVALTIGLTEWETDRTLDSAFEAALRHPRGIR